MQSQAHPAPSNPVTTYAGRIVLAWIVVTVLLFASAGRLNWPAGWLFSILWIVPKLIWIYGFLRHDPALAAERSGQHANTKRWDRVILTVYMIFSFGTIVVAGLDQRFGWSAVVPVAVVLGAAALYLAANLLVGWVTQVNTYFSSVARIQSDRGHSVISTGPYAIVRHPTYAITVLIWLITPLMLESWWGVIPGALAGMAMIVRTALEDRMLHDELPGYVEYAQQTHYRLLPGVW